MSAGASGFDLVACNTELIKILPGKTALIPTGVAVQIPEGFEGQIRPRSGLAFKDSVTVLNAPGTIDSDYRGEILVLLINHGEDVFYVGREKRIAQLVIVPISTAELEQVDSLDDSVRDEKGFGSTGCKAHTS
jgi:dUTP pyrophosphatase